MELAILATDKVTKAHNLAMEANNVDWSKPIEGQQINSSSIFAALGINGLGYANVGTSIVEREFTALSFIAYWEIIKEYYANKQEGIGAVIHNEGFPKTITYAETIDTLATIPQDLHATSMIATGTGINLLYTGAAPEIDTIIVKGGYTSATVKKYKLKDAFSTITILAGVVQATNPNIEFAYICAWDYVEVTKTTPKIKTFPLSNIDDMRMNILADIKNTQPFIIDSTSDAPYGLALAKYGNFYSKTGTQEALS